MKTMIIIMTSLVVLALIALAIGIWFIPFTVWSVSAAGVATRVVMPMTAQIFLKSFIDIICISGVGAQGWGLHEIVEYT